MGHTAYHDSHEAYKAMIARGIEEKTQRAEDYLAGWNDKKSDAEKWGALFAGLKEREIAELQKQLDAARASLPQSQDIRNDALEEAAKVCDTYSAEKAAAYKRGVGPERGNPYYEGQSDGADKCADAIRELQSQPSAPHPERSEEDGGWLVERESPAWYLTAGCDGRFGWSPIPHEGLRFARKEDGEAIRRLVKEAERVCFHVWGGVGDTVSSQPPAAPEQPKTMTMGERYGDGSDCISCNGCHMCVTCGDCKCSQPSSVAMTDVWLDYLDVDRILEIGKQFFTYEPVQFGLGTCVKGSIGSLVQFAHAVRDEVVLQSSTASSTAQEASNQGELHGFPERDPSKPAEQQGIFRKFDVRRVDGSDQPGGKHYGCRYFVLDLNHDQHAPAAMRAYAYACCETHPQLSADILAEFATLSASPSDADKRDADFFRGVIAALGALRPHSSHGDTLHDEIVISVGKERLYAIAEPEDVEWAGLDPEFYAAISRMRDGREKP